MDFQQDYGSEIDSSLFTLMLMRFTLFLYNNASVSRKFIDIIIKSFNSFICYLFIPYLKQQIQADLRDEVHPDTVGKVLLILDNNRSPFSSLLTEKQRFAMYKKKSVFQTPQDFTIGERDVKIGLLETVKKTVFGIHISLPETLKVYLQIPGIFKSMMKYQHDLLRENKTFSNIIQGRLWLKKFLPFLKDKIVFPLIVFFDDCELRNPLGSHSGEQKFGAVYISLPTLPPHLSAKLSNILISTIFHSKDREEYGNESCFEPLLRDLKYLSEVGISITIDGVVQQVYFECVLFVGDNLGLNQCCGFVSNFLTDYCCRICRATADQSKRLVTECSSLLRNVKNYAEDVMYRTGGVVQECLFNRLPRFHIAENRSLDLMHDLFEGVVPSVIGKVLTVFVFKKKYFTLDALNHRIATFDYGEHETNKPRPITVINCTATEREETGLSQRIRIRQSAAEMLCLSKYLILMIGDLVPKHDEYWLLYRILRKIIGTVIAPRFTRTDVLILSDNITNHHKLYIKLFGLLKPKFHFMIHLPQIMLDNGPLIHFWSMAFERKHADLKDVADGTSSSRNLPKTIAIRNLLKLCYLKEFTPRPTEEFPLGTVVNERVSPSELRTRVASYTGNHWAKIYRDVEVLGKRFTNGTVFMLRADEYGDPVFAKVKEVIEVNRHIYLLVCSLYVIYYEDSYECYVVADNDVPDEFVNIDLIPKVSPCLLTKKDGRTLVMPRHDV
ncbi:hypothetical protein QAD02_007951 [Eretmocerus hayati]|uniref:Uncharacterized protein n=1 Tax=Eretmocerus hayati TaxID=131215 RepID=A0ACC2N7I6_9HYME|nr:hypothetical protein QAD02_007951 [Eretmocerus hayati]